MTQRNPSFDVATVASFMTCLEDPLRADQRPVWGFWRKALSLAVGGLPAEGSDVVLWGRASRRCTGLYEAVPLHHPAAGDQLCLWGSISALLHPSAFGVKYV